VQEELHTFKLDFLNNNLGTLDNFMQLIIQSDISKLYIVFRQICVVIFARTERRFT
jgi:hypothetical protein